jgi:hypothetical protein
MLLYIRGSHSTSLGIICPRSLQHQDPIGPAQEARPGQRGVINRSKWLLPEHCSQASRHKARTRPLSRSLGTPQPAALTVTGRWQASPNIWMAGPIMPCPCPTSSCNDPRGPTSSLGLSYLSSPLASEIDHFADKPSTCWWYSFSWIRTQENKFVANSGAPLYCNGLDGDHIETMPKKEQSVVLVKKWLLLTLPS